jgi:two-component system response regulator AtoC
MAERVLVVEDEQRLRENLVRYLARQGHETVGYGSAEEFLEAPPEEFDVALLDIRLPGKDGLSLAAEIHMTSPDTLVLVMTAYDSVKSAVDALHAGVQDYLIKPVRLEDVARKIEKMCEHRRLLRENARLRTRLAELQSPELPIVRSRSMATLMDFVRQVASSNATVLIEGESGSGKEVVARALHDASPRHERPFLAVNVTAIPEPLIESYLFGHEKGAFTGAEAFRQGLFRAASGGTLFLDEVGDLPLTYQVKLLRAIESKEILPVGSDRPIRVDTRLVAATNRDLKSFVEEKRFRTDLYYRLSAIRVRVPPLRERAEDIAALAQYFLDKHAKEHGRPVVGFDSAALRRLLTYGWPGNVRELSNVVERATIVCPGKIVGVGDLPPEVAGGVAEGLDYQDALADFERAFIATTLERTGGDRREAARVLNISLATLYRRLEKLGLKPAKADEPEPPETGQRTKNGR